MSHTESAPLKFVLLTTQRSGSTFIRLCINSHPSVRCHSEIFLRTYLAQDGFKVYCERHLRTRLLHKILSNRYTLQRLFYDFGFRQATERFLHELYCDPDFSGPWTDMSSNAWETDHQLRENPELEKAVGFQLMYGQLKAHRSLQAWLEREHASIVHLVRANALKLLVSREIAAKTKAYHFARAGSRTKIRLDPETIVEKLDRIVGEQEGLRSKFPHNAYLEISYEGFLADPAVEVAKVFDFLMLQESEGKFPEFFKKLNPDSLADLIRNYEDIAASLRGTRHQRFLV